MTSLRRDNPWKYYFLLGLRYAEFYTIAALSLSLCFLYMFRLLIKYGLKGAFHVKTRETPPKCLSDPIYGQHHYVQLKDIRLHYVEAGQKDKPLIIFLHGFISFWYTWKHQILEFSKDYRVIALDSRGFGDSGKPSGIENYRLDHPVEDIKGLLDSIGVEKCILVGHVWGGGIIFEFARKYPERLIKYAVLNGPEIRIFMEFMRKDFDQLLKSWYIYFFQVPYLPEIILRMYDLKPISQLIRGCKGSRILTLEDLEAYKYIYSRPGALTPPVNYYRALAYEITVEEEKPREPIAVPGLSIIAKNSLQMAIGSLVESAKVNGGEHMKIVFIDNVAQFLQVEKPDEINKVLHEFLRND